MRKIPVEGVVNKKLAIAVIENIEKLDAVSNDDIYLIVNGPGGCCYSMLGIIDAMKRAKSRVGVVVVGQAMSADFLIMASAEKGMRLAFRNSALMAHEPRATIDVLDESSQKGIEAINTFMIDFMKRELHISETELEELISRDAFMTPHEALEYGFIDKVIEDF